MTRLCDPVRRAALKTAWRMLVPAVGGVDAMAACTRATRSMVSEYGSRSSERFPPADVILDAEIIAEAPLVTAALAEAQGYALVRREAMPAARVASLLASVGQESGQVFAAAAAALADGKITEGESATLLRELGELERAVAHAIAALRGPAEAAGREGAAHD